MPPSSHEAMAELLRSVAAGRPPEPRPFRPLDDRGWHELSALILAHHLPVALAPAAAQAGMPDDLSGTLGEAARWHRMRTHALLLELGPALDALERAGTTPVVLKGAALAQTFGVPRVFGDLDVLVPGEAVERAAAELRALGYTAAETARSAAFYERHHFHRVLRSSGGVTLELHWALSRPSDFFRLDPEGVRARSRTIPFGEGTMRVPSAGDQLLHGAAQSLRDGFVDARRVLDAARLLVAGAGVEPGLSARARESGLAGALWVLLGLAHALAGVAAEPLAAEVAPPAWRRRSLESLDLPAMVLDRHAAEMHGLKTWLLLLCAPGPWVTARTFWGNVFQGERGLLDDGHRPSELPGPLHRAMLSAKRIGQAVRLAGYQTLRLLSRHRE